jgi:hypothetical protein
MGIQASFGIDESVDLACQAAVGTSHSIIVIPFHYLVTSLLSRIYLNICRIPTFTLEGTAA